MIPEVMASDDERTRLLELLEATHKFPVQYPLTVIILNDAELMANVRAAVQRGLPEALPDSALEVVSSSAARYLSLRFRVPCSDAQEILNLHERVKRVTGVL